MRAERLRPLGLALAGVAAMLLLPRWAALGWLAAAFLWSGVAVGSLGFLWTMRLIDGRWRVALEPAMRRGGLGLWVAIGAALPVVVGIGTLYPWAAHPAAGFAGAWLTPLGFALRTILWLAGLAALARRDGQAAAIGGLAWIAIGGTLVAVDWLMSLDPAFHSSGFGLQALCIQFEVALALSVLRAPPERSGTAGALLLTLAMFWGYFAYLQFFIIWSGNLPAGAAWYLRRAAWPWNAVAAKAALLHAGPLLALLSPTMRRSPRGLRIAAAALIAGDMAMAAWLVLPEAGGSGLAAILAFAVALVLIGLPTVLAGARR